MATLIPAGIAIPDEGLRNGSITNKDGHGWAVASVNGLFVGKSMKFEEALAGLKACREREGIRSIAMFHSRFGTHGEYGEYNIHPFYVGKDEQTAMAHNGVLPSKFLPDHKDRRSDTRILADYFGYTGEVDNSRGVPSRGAGGRIGKMIGSNKLVFLSVKSGKPVSRIINSHLGTWDGGVWYSNSGYCPRPSYSYSGGVGRYIGGHSYGGWQSEPGGYMSRSDRRDSRVVAFSSKDKTPGEMSASELFWAGIDEEDEKYGDWRGKDREGWAKDPTDNRWRRQCKRCESLDIDLLTGVCNDCLLCYDCEEHVDACLCFTPTARYEDRSPWDPTTWDDSAGEEVVIVEGEVVDLPPVAPPFTGWKAIVDKMSDEGKENYVRNMSPEKIATSPIAIEILRQRFEARQKSPSVTPTPETWERIVDSMDEEARDKWLEDLGTEVHRSPIAQEILRRRTQAAIEAAEEAIALPSGQMKAMG